MRVLSFPLAFALVLRATVAAADDGAPAAARITVTAESESADGDVIPLVAAAAQRALPAIAKWGGLRRGIAIVILPDRDSLQIRAGAEGAEWLAGFAQTRYDRILLLSPHQLGQNGRTASSWQLTNLLEHELTHCAMSQIAGDGRVPFWFNEGMAMTTAQENWQLSRQELADVLGRRPNIDPLRNSGLLVRGEAKLVYSTAFWSFTLLEERGLSKVQQLLAIMHEGPTFADAFARVYGETHEAFMDRLLAALRSGDPLR